VRRVACCCLLAALTACGGSRLEGPLGGVAGAVDASDADAGPPEDAAAPEPRPDPGRDAALPPDVGPDIGSPAADAGAPALDAGEGPGPTPGPGPGCGRAPPTTDGVLVHDGRSRAYRVHVPTGYDPHRPAPLVLDLHGRGFTGAAQAAVSRLSRLADAEGFVVVHPEGLERTWNAGVCCGEAMQQGVDDVGFLRALVDRLDGELCLDRRRIHATGLSNGGYLAHRLACEAGELVASVAPVAGGLGVAPCRPPRAVPVLHIHGTDDRVVPYDGWGGALSAPATVRGWAERNGCDPTPSLALERGDVRCERWTGCRDGAEVQLCTVLGGGHTWPGGPPLPGLGPVSQDLDASRAAWDFFVRHPRR
jgi:polyhydroxybutyrate depolymerase